MTSVCNESDLNGFECAICLELLCEPVQLPCSHVFCRKCLAGVVQQSRSCALCRASVPDNFNPINAPLHSQLEQILVRQCTVEYAARVDELALEAARLVRLKVSNTHELLSLLPRPKHQWTVEVELEAQPEACLPRGSALPDIVKQVSFELPPACKVVTYGPHSGPYVALGAEASVDVNQAPFQVTATSPTSCTIPIVITWKDWIGQPPLRLEHELDFLREGGSWDYGVDLHAALTGSALRGLESAQNLQRSRTMALSDLSATQMLSRSDDADLNRARMEIHNASLLRRRTPSPDSRCTLDSTARSSHNNPTSLSAAWSSVSRRFPKVRIPLRRKR